MADKRDCLVCKKSVAVRKNGALYAHGCAIDPNLPSVPTREMDAAIVAMHAKNRPASVDAIEEGLMSEPSPNAETHTSVGREVGLAPSGDAFVSPTKPVIVVPELNVSGQPKARYQWHGKQNKGYLVKDPRTGDFNRYKNGNPKGWTRATTFNKAASDQNSLSAWGKRNVLVGASMRPDLVAEAFGKPVDDRKTLDPIVAQLEEVAGAKVSANIGTIIHELTERWDGGQLDPADVPPQYREQMRLYIDCLRENGLAPVPGLIERTVFVEEFGGIVGTFDRVYLHEPSGNYLIGDVKTGKTLAYGMDEIETQEWIYAHGINAFGVYDWNTDTWQSPKSYGDSVATGPWSVPEVSEEWGVVIHLPVQGDDAGTCTAVRADLQRGRRHAEVCHAVRVQRSNKPKPEPFTPDDMFKDVPEVSWDQRFAQASSRQELSDLYTEVYRVLEPMEVQRLVSIGRQRLTELSA